MKYDYLVVGSGLYGAVFAREAADRGKKVLVIDKRPKVAGNIYTEKVEGIHVHKYGAHIFHTSDKKIWDYVNRFAEFNHYINSPVAVYKDELYNLPFNMNTFSKMWNIKTPAEAKQKIAEQIAEETQCLGLITGESIGQVASQTMHSLAATNEVCTMPVYRPLIGMDKQEIVEISEKIGTYETSILPYEDCCTIFVAKHPVTKPNIGIIKKHEKNLEEKIDELVKTALDTKELVVVSPMEESL